MRYFLYCYLDDYFPMYAIYVPVDLLTEDWKKDIQKLQEISDSHGYIRMPCELNGVKYNEWAGGVPRDIKLLTDKWHQLAEDKLYTDDGKGGTWGYNVWSKKYKSPPMWRKKSKTFRRCVTPQCNPLTTFEELRNKTKYKGKEIEVVGSVGVGDLCFINLP